MGGTGQREYIRLPAIWPHQCGKIRYHYLHLAHRLRQWICTSPQEPAALAASGHRGASFAAGGRSGAKNLSLTGAAKMEDKKGKEKLEAQMSKFRQDFVGKKNHTRQTANTLFSRAQVVVAADWVVLIWRAFRSQRRHWLFTGRLPTFRPLATSQTLNAAIASKT